jgi:hypothetical protein
MSTYTQAPTTIGRMGFNPQPPAPDPEGGDGGDDRDGPGPDPPLFINPPLGPALTKTTGALPVIFTGERDKAEAFLKALKGYLHLNERVPPLDTWCGKTALAPTLIQGEAVEGFAREQGDIYDGDPHKIHDMWIKFLQAFEHCFLDTRRDAKAQESIEKLTLEDGNIDLYIQNFKSLVHKAQYNLQEHSVI